jgi:tetrahydromethanopterin S-methyltransferase subunit B
MRSLLFFLILVLSLPLMAQRRGNPALSEDAPLRQQFDEMLEVSNRYREGSRQFKVVPRDYLEAFMTNVSDSISTYTVQIDELQRRQDELESQIEETASEVSDRDDTIGELRRERDTVSLLGMQLDKGTYSLIMWGLVIGLLIAFLVAMASTRVAAGNNTSLKRERDKLAAELEESRRSRLTVEQELRRQLQDEINKRNQ